MYGKRIQGAINFFLKNLTIHEEVQLKVEYHTNQRLTFLHQSNYQNDDKKFFNLLLVHTNL